ncbi:MAG: alpha/beta hydrolase [Verrucomicrobiota bacterium]|nr:alpha/beta hydrolase [Verrucomicrobiota bacterium]
MIRLRTPLRATGTRFLARITRLGLALAGLFVLGGCSLFLRNPVVPIPQQGTRFSAEHRATTLVVFLPGRGGAMTDFEREGFVDVLSEAGVMADTIAVDAHLGYYYNRTVLERLQQDVLLPARQRCYSRIVLVGVSLGGLGALLNERDHPGSVDALVLLAPYLGDDQHLFEAIAASGGPAAWAIGRDPRVGDVEVQLWAFLGTRSTHLPPTWLLYGRSDYLGAGHRQLAGLLPKGHVMTIDGAHDWPTWRALWREVCFGSALFNVEKSAPTSTDTGPDTP